MNILYCIPHLYNSGGMERVLTQKVNWLCAHTSHSFTIITTEPTPQGMNDTYFPLDPQVQIVPLNIDFNADYRKPLLSKWWGHMRRMRMYKHALTQYIREHKIDLCISLCGKEIAFLRTLPCRTVAELHFGKDQRQQLLEANHSNPIWSLLGHIRTYQLIRAVKPLEQLIVLTEQDKTDWKKAGCTNVICIPNPCSLDGHIIPMKSKKNVLLAVGRLHEQKGFDLLLQAWKPIEENHPEWALRIVGEGPKREELEALVKTLKLKRVALLGRTNEVINEYTSASLFVLSSRYEGLPLALIEAMWCGTPAVAFDCPHGPAELLTNNRGWLVSNGDIRALSAQLDYAITHPEEAAERARKAQAFAQATYSEHCIMPKWIELIESRI